MNGISTALLANSPKSISQSMNATSETVNTGASFSELFEQLSFYSEILPLTDNKAGEPINLADILTNIYFGVQDLEEVDQIRELLDLLPFEWQQDIYQFSQDHERDINQIFQWPEEQQVVFLLINAIGSQLQESKEIKVPLQELAARVFGLQVTVADSTEEMVHKIKRDLETKKDEGQSIIDLLIKKESGKPLLNVNLPIFNEPMPLQGLNISHTGQALSRVEQAVIHIGDKLPKELQQQQFLRQFQSLMQRSIFTQTADGINTLSIKLFPAHLGRLDIQIMQIDGVITARILSGSAQTRELIEMQIAQLRNALNQQQLQVERIEVAHQFEREKDDQSSRRNHSHEDSLKDEADSEAPADFEEFLKEISINEQI
jgi:flagellar hook-length control protein FliK